jgi:demethylmenaquinone methyltransferase / 2-methoxy-6-polyprenyl-1,4-benzoquinol methylase
VALSTRTRHARALFAGIAPQYGWMGAVWSFGQDVRWRRFLVSRIPRGTGSVLDVASGTGLVSRALLDRDVAGVTQIDPSRAMLEAAPPRKRLHPVRGRAEELPFPDETFDALTVTYLLRYVDDPGATVRELARVVRPGGVVASLEFHVPNHALACRLWHVYTRSVMPATGALVSPAWRETGRFLGPSIEAFWAEHPMGQQLTWWREAGFVDVRVRRMSFGAGVVIWARKDAA